MGAGSAKVENRTKLPQHHLKPVRKIGRSTRQQKIFRSLPNGALQPRPDQTLFKKTGRIAHKTGV
jgi:hypothetical protein